MRYDELEELFDRLWPICRSITGPGISKSLSIMSDYLPLNIKKISTGDSVFDWVVPKEWELISATLKTEDGKLILDAKDTNLHVVNFSEPFSGVVNYQELNKHLHSDPDFPEAIPYVTSYYSPRWGFCLSEYQRMNLDQSKLYNVDIKTRKFDGFLRYGECTLQGETDQTILITSYLCHPSMANNELSGPLALAAIYNKLKREKKRKFNYRFILIPETIGSLAFLANTSKKELSQICAGIVLTCLGGPSQKISLKHSRRHWLGEESDIDLIVESVCRNVSEYFTEREFTPTGGSDERQFCSPMINMPVIQAARTIYGQYDEYHTHLDNKEFMRISAVDDAAEKIFLFLKIFELDKQVLKPVIEGGEPMLGKRNLYPTINSALSQKTSTDDNLDNRKQLDTLLNIISLVDGTRSLRQIVEKLNASYVEIIPIVKKLMDNGVIKSE